MSRSTADPTSEAAVCERAAPDGTPHFAFLSGPDEIALRISSAPDRWLLLSVKSGRLEDGVAAVVALRALEAALARMPAFVSARLDAYSSRPAWEAHGPSASAVWTLFKHNLVGEIRAIAAGEGDGAPRPAPTTLVGSEPPLSRGGGQENRS